MKYIAELDRPESVEMRAVGIAFNLRESVMLPVNGDPLTSGQSRGQPQREPEDKCHRAIQLERFVCGASMKVDCGAEDGDLSDDRRHQQAPQKPQKHGNLQKCSASLAR
jgi:hypothetical protein